MKFAKTGSKFPQIPNNPSKYCPRLLIYAKVAKFRQIWSHWLDSVLAFGDLYIVQGD